MSSWQMSTQHVYNLYKHAPGTQVLTANGIHKVVELSFEDIQSVLQDLLIVGSPQGNKVELLLHSTADGW